MENAECGMNQNLDIFKFFDLEDSRDMLVEKYCNATLLRMLEEGVHVDVTIHANGGSVKAHKCVLASVSPVFEAMFMHAMQEQLTSAINLPDISIESLELFLVLVYVLNDNITPPLEFTRSVVEHFDELFQACCKYQVKRLRPTLIASLEDHLNTNNCWDYLNDDSAEWIHNACWEYALKNYMRVIKSMRFTDEMETNSGMIQNYLIALLDN